MSINVFGHIIVPKYLCVWMHMLVATCYIAYVHGRDSRGVMMVLASLYDTCVYKWVLYVNPFGLNKGQIRSNNYSVYTCKCNG